MIPLYQKGGILDRRRLLLALACAAQFIVVLDVSVVNVALPSISASLGLDETVLPWVVNAYALVFAGFLLMGGRLADVIGRRRAFLAGLALFCVASLVGGTAVEPGALIAARAVQGLGAAVLAPATLTLLTTTFPEGNDRTRALAIWAAVGMAGGTAGNLAGGVLTEYLSWRATLLINVPIGVVAAPLALSLLARDRASTAARLDVPGALTATAGLITLTYGITQLRDADSLAVAAAFAGLTLLALFAAHEARHSDAALIPVRLFRLRAVSAGNVVLLLAGACLNPMWYFLSLAMQELLHYGPLATGLGFLPHTLVSILLGVSVVPRLMRHVGTRALIATGASISAAGFGWQSLLTPDSGYVLGLLGPGILIAIGGGLLNTPITTVVTSGVAAEDAGAASGLMNTTKQVGGAVGLAAVAAATATADRAPEALAAAYGHAFLLMTGLMLATALATAMLPRAERTEAVAS